MLVVDASAVIEVLLNSAVGRRVAEVVGEEDLHAPHLIDLELVSVLNRLTNSGKIPAGRAVAAIDSLGAMGVRRHAHEPLLSRIHALRANLTAYDAAYIALAEGLQAPLLTCDRKLAASPGHGAQILTVA